eukprot:8559936-Heterocapsa_arctica.AAC.1
MIAVAALAKRRGQRRQCRHHSPWFQQSPAFLDLKTICTAIELAHVAEDATELLDNVQAPSR